jgi:hypothetical protein
MKFNEKVILPVERNADATARSNPEVHRSVPFHWEIEKIWIYPDSA